MWYEFLACRRFENPSKHVNRTQLVELVFFATRKCMSEKHLKVNKKPWGDNMKVQVSWNGGVRCKVKNVHLPFHWCPCKTIQLGTFWLFIVRVYQLLAGIIKHVHVGGIKLHAIHVRQFWGISPKKSCMKLGLVSYFMTPCLGFDETPAGTWRRCARRRALTHGSRLMVVPAARMPRKLRKQAMGVGRRDH